MEREGLWIYFKSEEAKQFYMECLKKEFGTSSGGINTMLHERYGSWFNPGFTRIVIEGKKEER